jgi:hypothetical protein
MDTIVLLVSGVMIFIIIAYVFNKTITKVGNWFSAEARAERAERAGHIGEALQRYAEQGNGARLQQCLSRVLPNWPVRTSLLRASSELVELGKSIPIARTNGVPETMTDWLAQEAQTAAEALWASADRIAAVAAIMSHDEARPRAPNPWSQSPSSVPMLAAPNRPAPHRSASLNGHGATGLIESQGLQQRLQQEAEKLDRLREAMRQSREGLAEVILSGGGSTALEEVDRRFRMLTEATHELAKEGGR